MPKKSNWDLNEFKLKREIARAGSTIWLLSVKDLNSAYKAGERDFSHCILEGSRASEKDYSGADFSYSMFNTCHFITCNFSNSNLSHCSIINTSIISCQFNETNLYSSNIKSCYISYSNMVDVNAQWTEHSFNRMLYNFIKDSDFENARFTGVQFSACKIIRSIFRNISMDMGSLNDSHLIESDFSYSDLGEALIRAYLENTNIENTKGIYIAYGSEMSSRGDALYAGIVIDNDEIKLRFWAGCNDSITKKELVNALTQTHGESSLYTLQYRKAVNFIRSMFEIDMTAGNWEYSRTYDIEELRERAAKVSVLKEQTQEEGD